MRVLQLPWAALARPEFIMEGQARQVVIFATAFQQKMVFIKFPSSLRKGNMR
jgi:hypothetical protein